MIDPVKSVSSSPTSTPDRRRQNAPAQPAAATASPQTPSPQATSQPTSADNEPLRLVVEPTGGGTGYTYKLFDRVTGELLMELPREDAAKMGDSPDYAAGQVFSAKA